MLLKMKKITNYHNWLKGAAPLPAGAIPMAGHTNGAIVCLMPTGRWIKWQYGVSKNLPPETQKEVMEVVIKEMGGTAQSTADKLSVSRRTVESWRSRASILPIGVSYKIAEILSINP